jgi:Bacterial Ig domain
MLFRRRALFLAGLFAAVSCSDAGNPAGPEGPGPRPGPEPEDVVQALACTVNIGSQQMRCELPTPGTGAAQGLIIGGTNGFNVLLTSSNFTNVADTLSFDVTVQNLIGQALGVTPAGGVAPDGLRVFFGGDPAVTPGPGPVTDFRILSDGAAVFLMGVSDYFQYDPAILPVNATSPAERWKFYTLNVQSFSFVVYVYAQVQFPDGWTDIEPDAPLIEVGGVDTLVAHVRNSFGRQKIEDITWSTSNPGVLLVSELAPSDSLAQITAVSEGTAWVKAMSGKNGVRRDSVLVTVNNAPVVSPDAINGISNVTDSIPAPRLANNVTEPGATIVPGTYPTVMGGTATVYADGGFTYLSSAGFAGVDTVKYPVTDGGWTVDGKVVVTVEASNYWYVQAGASGNGRDRSPFGTLAAAVAAASDADSILVLNGVGEVPAGATLDPQQALLGAGIPASITRPLNGHSVTILGAGSAPGLTRADAGAAVTLSTDNTIRGVGITATAGAAIAGSGFGTLTASHLGVTATGPALNLANGALAADFTTLSSTSSTTSGLALSNLTGTLTGMGAISGAASTGIAVSGGSLAFTYGGNVTQSTAAALLDVTGNHTGSLTFNGTLSASAGTGLQFNDADGTYAFNGTSTLAGGNAGVDIGNGSGGTFTFAAATTITSPTGTGFSVNGSSPTVTYSGNITQGNNALLVDVSEQPAGSVTFQTGTLSASNGAGILLSNADGSVSFNGTNTLNGGDAGVDVTAGSNGTIAFAATSSITNPTGVGLLVFESAPSLTYAGSIAANAGRPVEVNGASPCGTVTVSGTITSTGQGLLVQDCSAGTVSFTGGTKTLNTGVNQGVTLTNNAGAAINFSGGGLAITTTSAPGFGATTGGSVQVTGASNTISTVTGTGLSLNGVGTGASGVTFRSVSTGGAANGIALTNLTGVGVSVTGDGATAGSGGTISGTTGHGVSLTTLGSLTTGVALNFVNVNGGSGGNAAVFGTTFGALSFNGTQLSGVGGPALNLTTGTLSGTLASLGSSSSASNGVALTGVAGTLNSSAGTLAGSAAGAAFLVSGGTLGGTIASAVSQANAAPLVSIVGAHNTGTLTFTGTVSATSGTGLQFTDADGTYAFNGTTNLAGGDAGIDIAAASSGTVNVAPSGGNTAAVTSPSGIAIAVLGGSADLNYSGNVTQANAQPLLSVSGGHTGDLAFPTGTISATNGSGLQFDNSDGTYAFSGTVTLNGGDAGIDITNNSGGTFTFPATASITNPNAGNLVSVLNSAPSFTYSGSFSKANNNVTGILVSNNTGGTINFNGSGVTKSISSGNAAAVNLATNTGATINFSGGSLAITSGSGAGITATGGGTLNVTGASNTISSGTGTALNVQNTTIGASGLSFLSITASGGANGIHLANTGITNGLQVTGSGTVGSGGTITNMTGADGSTSGNGVYLNGTRNVSLSWMNFSGSQNNGVYGTGVRGFTMDKTRFTGMANGSGASAANNESNVQLVNVGGAVKLTNSRFDGAGYNGVRIENISGTAPVLDSLVMAFDTVATMQGSTGDVRGTALLVNLQDGTVDARIRNNHVQAWWGNAIHVLVHSSASGTARITNNFADNTNGALAGAGGIWVAGSNLAYNISGNTVRHTNGTAISADRNKVGANMNGTIDGNFVGVSGDSNSGSGTGIGIYASHTGPGTTTVKISNNVIRQINGSANGAITTSVGDAAAGGGSGVFNATVTGNNIQESGSVVNAAQSGILVTHGVQSGPPNDTDQGCYNVLSNTITNFNTASVATRWNLIRVNQRFGTTSRWPGYTGAATGVTSQTDIGTYLLSRNTASNSTNANTSTGGFLNTSPAGSACPQPSI